MYVPASTTSLPFPHRLHFHHQLSKPPDYPLPADNPTIGALGPRSTVATFTKTMNGAVATAVVTFSDMDAEPTCKDKHALPNDGRRRGKKNRRIDVDVDVDAELMMWA